MEDSIRLGELADFVAPQAHTRAELALLYGDLGIVAHGLETVQMALTISEIQMPNVRAHALGILAQLHILNGSLDDAEEAIDAGKKDPGRESWPVFYLPVVLAEGELALKQGDYQRAMAVTDAFLTRLRQYGIRSQVPHALYVQGQALSGLGQAEDTRHRLLGARAEAEAIGSRRTLWRILYALSQLEDDTTESELLRQEAVQVVDYIAGHIEQADLRRSFLSLPDVRAVLGPKQPKTSEVDLR